MERWHLVSLWVCRCHCSRFNQLCPYFTLIYFNILYFTLLYFGLLNVMKDRQNMQNMRVDKPEAKPVKQYFNQIRRSRKTLHPRYLAQFERLIFASCKHLYKYRRNTSKRPHAEPTYHIFKPSSLAEAHIVHSLTHTHTRTHTQNSMQTHASIPWQNKLNNNAYIRLFTSNPRSCSIYQQLNNNLTAPTKYPTNVTRQSPTLCLK